MATIISVSNIKGGVCKTTTASTLAAGLNRRGNSVLMIDSDPQTNLTMCVTQEPGDDTPTLYTLYSAGASVPEIRIPVHNGLDLVPGDFNLCSADMEFLGRVGSLRMLSKALKCVSAEYDYIIIDTPPNLGFLSLNAFMASDYIITPMSADSFSLKAIRLLRQTLDEVSEEAGRDIPVAGILLTKFSGRTNLAKVLEDSIAQAAALLNTSVFESRIRQAVVVPESQVAKMDLFEYAPKASVTQDYDAFIEELLGRIQ